MFKFLFICLMVIGTIANGMLECIKAFLLNYTDDKSKKQIATIKIDSNASKDRPGRLLMLA